jgi:flagellar assembly protein FliH
VFDVDLRHAVPVHDERADEVLQAARSAGYAAGWAQGQQAAREASEAMRQEAERVTRAHRAARAEALDRALAAVAGAADALERRAVTAAGEVEELILASAVDLAEALLGRELSDPTVRGLDAVRRALSLTPSGVDVTVRLHPEDHDTLTGALDAADGGRYTIEGRAVRLVADGALAAGDATAEYATTTVDASLGAAMARVREVLAA